MADSDLHLTGGIMALIVMALVFDDEKDLAPAPRDDQLDQGPGRPEER